jgi:hypothetical protein
VKVGDGRMDSVVETTQLILGYCVNNIRLFKPPERYEKKKVLWFFDWVSLTLVIYIQNVFPLVDTYGITHKNISVTETVNN